MNFHHKGIISVIGSNEVDSETAEKARKIGQLIAKNNYILACGGMRGVMEAACKGCKEENGLTIGILPSGRKSDSNPYVDIKIPTALGQARNTIVTLTGDGVIAIAGNAGTLSEICFAWIYNKPIVVLTGVEGWSSKMADKKIDYRRKDKIHKANTPEEAVKKIIELIEAQ
jgi:uncharacterized protein (TIGR00725 family)